MNTFQKTIKYLAMALAIFLVVSIFGGIFSMLGLFGGFLGGGTVAEDIKTYTVTQDISNLEVVIFAADFTIKEGDKFSVESNIKRLTVENEGGTLTIKETKKLGITYRGAVVTLYIPANTVFEKTRITTGAGKLNVDRLSSDIMKFELGAGEVNIGNLAVTSDIEIDSGTGEITISGGALHNLDLDMGVGQLNLTSALTGEADLDLGVGESDITVIGNKDDYKLSVEKGLGNITVDGVEVSGIKGLGNGKNSIDIDGGVGAIKLMFKESETTN